MADFRKENREKPVNIESFWDTFQPNYSDMKVIKSLLHQYDALFVKRQPFWEGITCTSIPMGPQTEIRIFASEANVQCQWPIVDGSTIKNGLDHFIFVSQCLNTCFLNILCTILIVVHHLLWNKGSYLLLGLAIRMTGIEWRCSCRSGQILRSFLLILCTKVVYSNHYNYFL